MPTKKKSVVKMPQMTVVKTSAMKKRAAKPVVKAVAKPVVKSVAKPVAKPVVAKKVTAAVVHAPVARRRVVVAETIHHAPEVSAPAPHVHGKTVTHHRVVLYETCVNCKHMPDNIHSLLGTLSVLVAILSGMVLSLAPLPKDWQNLVAQYVHPSVEQSIAQK